MSRYSELLSAFSMQPDDEQPLWLEQQLTEALRRVSELRGGSNVLIYGSAFLQKTSIPAHFLHITLEDINGLMATYDGARKTDDLTLILHTGGGVAAASQTIVEYLRDKYRTIETIVPTYAMSTGTMIALASDRILLGAHSQLGPIDPQMPAGGGRTHSALAVVDQFNRASEQILADPAYASVWAPILAGHGPSLLQEAQNALDYAEEVVTAWLERFMFRDDADRSAKAAEAARYFNDARAHKNHGRRLGIDDALKVGLDVHRLEEDLALRDAVLTAYHAMTIFFEQTYNTKVIWSDSGSWWTRSWVGARPAESRQGKKN